MNIVNPILEAQLKLTKSMTIDKVDTVAKQIKALLDDFKSLLDLGMLPYVMTTGNGDIHIKYLPNDSFEIASDFNNDEFNYGIIGRWY